MGRRISIQVSKGDVTRVAAEVVAVKYAEGLVGSALAVASALGKTEEELAPGLSSVGTRCLLPAEGKIEAAKVLFLSVVSLARFDYIDVERFAFDVLAALSDLAPETRHLALTLHGTGFGLSPSRVLQSEVKGISDAVAEGAHPLQLERVTIIDRDDSIVAELRGALSYLLPGGEVEAPDPPDPSPPAGSRQRPDFSEPAEGSDFYDVFISHKSGDAKHALQVYDFLVSRGLRVFFSKESLPRLGSSEYHKQIDLAIDRARHMVVVASCRENLEARWVEYEWRMFLQLILKGRKNGNLLSVLAEDMDVDTLPNALSGFEAIRLMPGELERLLGYVGRDESEGHGQAGWRPPASPPHSRKSHVADPTLGSDPDRFARVGSFFVARTEVLENSSWLRARSHAGTLSMGGTGGWRLPTLDQLRQIRSASLFPDEWCCWSREEAGEGEAYYVHCDDGHVGRGPKTFGNGLRAIFVHEP